MKCPFCAEEIQENAIKCKHCKSVLSNKSSKGWIWIIVVIMISAYIYEYSSSSTQSTSNNESSFSLSDEERDSIIVDVWNSDMIYDANDFQYRIEIDNDGNNVYDLIEEKVKCYFPNVPMVNKIQHNAADFRVYSDQDTLTSLISTLNIAEMKWSENDYNAIYSVKDMFLKNSVNEYIEQLYGGYDYNIEIMDKIKFHQKHDGYAYQLSLSDEYCHKGVLFLVKNKIYHINVKGICVAKPLINYTYSLMHHTLKVK